MIHLMRATEIAITAVLALLSLGAVSAISVFMRDVLQIEPDAERKDPEQ